MNLIPRTVMPFAAGALVALAAGGVVPLHTQAATSIVVTTATDSNAANPTCANPCSLRQAITEANLDSGAVTITFGVAGPINLTLGSLRLTGAETLTIQGAADGSTTLHQNGTDRILLISNAGASTTLDDVTLTGGHSVLVPGTDDGFGGAIDVNTNSALVLINTNLTANRSDAGGGAVDLNTRSSMTVIDSTISGNTAGAEGGAIDANTGATMVVINSTLDGNTASAPGGGAIDAITAVTLSLVNDTITANTTPATVGQGAIQATGTGSVTAVNTIVSGNIGANCGGTVTDGGNNLEQGTSCAFTTNAQHGDPLLDALGSNGGFAPTNALKPGSPAIGTGSNTACAAATDATTPGAGGADERGATRPQATTCDIGAFEVVATITTLAAPATTTVGDAITLTATVTGKQEIPGSASGTVSFYDGTTLLGTATLVGDPTATLTTSALAAGSHSLTASFTQTKLFLASTSAASAVTVAIPVPTTGAGVPWAPGAVLVVLGLGLTAAVSRRRH